MPGRVFVIVLRCFAVLAALAALLSAVPISGQPSGNGRIAGTVRVGIDALPGARVTVEKPDLTRSTVSDADGRFQFSDLPEGTYLVTAELVGFQTQRQPDVTVGRGRTSTIALVLPIGCLSEILYVDLGIAWALQEADAILHLRISESAAVERWTFGDTCLMGRQYSATVIRVLKSPVAQAVPDRIARFVQEGTGRAAYSPGEEYVALLKWETGMDSFHPVAGPPFMFPTRDGRVVWRRTDAPGVRNGMLIDEFFGAMRVLLTVPPPR